MSLRDILLRLLEKKKPEEEQEQPEEQPEVAKNRRVFWAVTIALIALIGWSTFSSLLMPPHERQQVARAEKYASAGSQEFKAQAEARAEQPRVQRDNRPPPQEKQEKERRTSRPPREKKETEAQRLATQARNESHYARPLTIVQNGESLSPSNRNGRPGQTLEIPPAQRQFASNKEDQIANGDVWKRDFFEHNKDQTGILQPPKSPFMVRRGTLLPLELLLGIDTQVPGQITARVTQDIMDTATGQHVMIPVDTILIGRYETELGYQRKLPTAWDQMTFPNGEWMALSSFPGADRTGAAGMEIDVNRHLLRRAGYIAMVTLTGAAARAGSYAGGGSRDFENALQQQATREVYRESRQSYSRGGYSGATGTAQAGEHFLVQITEDLGPFPGDYYERKDSWLAYGTDE